MTENKHTPGPRLIVAALDLLEACEMTEKALVLYQQWVDMSINSADSIELDAAEDEWMQLDQTATQMRRTAIIKAYGKTD